ncbi:hypothetical protein MAPG_07924 [Magnaporthiopsis poae ATCC 64411]|uniref:Uncharacterized protein n=1 Tax=Magnaporthiopsis poae (strain ATCC 64411 / 73-15) TaxID=644358 RepID=A0A0C4E5Z5_MAGP6|nr:hypothetical protein MAPG_07924 [Magnaporthiopsis poae ATCC 64411]
MPHKSQQEPTSTKGRRHHNAEPRRHRDDHQSHRPERSHHHRQSFAEDEWTGWRQYNEGSCSEARKDPLTGQWVCKVITPSYPNGILVNTTEPAATFTPNTPSIPHAQPAYGPVVTPWPQQQQQQQSWPPTPQSPPDPWPPSPTTRWEQPQPQAPTSPVAADQYAVPGQMPEQQQQQQEYENHPAADNISNVSHDAGSAAAARPKRREMRVSMNDYANTEILLSRDLGEPGRFKFTVEDMESSITVVTAAVAAVTTEELGGRRRIGRRKGTGGLRDGRGTGHVGPTTTAESGVDARPANTYSEER